MWLLENLFVRVDVLVLVVVAVVVVVVGAVALGAVVSDLCVSVIGCDVP